MEWGVVVTVVAVLAGCSTLYGLLKSDMRDMIKTVEDKIASSKDELNGKITSLKDEVNDKIGFIRDDIKRVRDDIRRVEDDINKVEQQVTQTNARIDGLHILLTGSFANIVATATDSKNLPNLPAARRSFPPDPPAAMTAKSSSPITLSKRGQDVAKNIKANQLVDKYANRILIPDDADQLVIQNTCFSFASNSLMSIANQEEAKVIRDAIYQECGSSADIFIIYGILFRDHYLKARGFPVPKYAQ